MADIFTYLAWRGDLPMSVCSFQEVDGMILARLSYLPYELLLPEGGASSIAEAAALLPLLPQEAMRPEDRRLLTELAASERFRDLRISNYVNRRDAKTQTQFAAITIHLEDGTRYLSFRGTDNTLYGWKEDFNMSFVCPVPAQTAALHYLQVAALRERGALLLGGHSKGGNLAVYAAAFCGEGVQRRIRRVYNYDGPGFDERVLRQDAYREVCGRVHTFVPQSSVIGMLLGHEEQYTIVHSEESGLMQHDMYSWDVLRSGFSCLETVSNSSRFLDGTLKTWLQGMDYAQRETFFDTMYALLVDANVKTLRELMDNKFACAKNVLKALRKQDPETRRAVSQALLLLMKSTKVGLLRVMQSRSAQKQEKGEA